MASIESRIHQDIPIASAMDLKILSCTPLETTGQLPLIANRNHLNTQFGGSLYAASALGCYACLLKWLEEMNLKGEAIIVEGSIKYLHPGRGDSEIRAWTNSEELQKFGDELKAKKKSRIHYEATLSYNGKMITRFKGLYQILLRG